MAAVPHFTSWKNPHLPTAQAAGLTQNMPKKAKAQALAFFVTSPTM
jgi:hypothetical protein